MFKCSIGREDLLKPLGQISGVAGGSSGGQITKFKCLLRQVCSVMMFQSVR